MHTDAELMRAIRSNRVNDAGGLKPEALYGRRKMTALLRRQGHRVAACTVHRVMGLLGIQWVRRGRTHRTTTSDPSADRAPDLLNRDFTAVAPNTRWVADFTYVRTWVGFVYVAFVVDVFAQRILAWNASTSKATPLVLTALRMGLWTRYHAGRPVVADDLLHHSDYA